MICSEHMATLELPNSSIPLNINTFSGLVAGSMQRSRGMGRGSSADVTPLDTQVTPRVTRSNTKLKVLVRSHAMREETSPPREPTPTPCINLIPSPSVSPEHSISPVYNHSPPAPTAQNPCLVLSPRCSPTATIVVGSPSPSPTPVPQPPAAVSPEHASHIGQSIDEDNAPYVPPQSATVRTQEALTSALTRKLNGASDDAAPKTISNSDTNTNSHSSSSPTQISYNNQKNSVSKPVDSQRGREPHSLLCCDCFHPNCAKCSLKTSSERNVNNNNSNSINNNNVISSTVSHSSNTLTVSRATTKHKLRHQSSSQGSFEGSSTNSPCLSRDSSTEQYTDTTGTDLPNFITETLNKNAKDRVMMLKIEQELVNLAKDKIKTHFKFPPMSSYQRMLVHRCAAYFGMDHNVETSGRCVVVNKTKNTRIPEMKFREQIREDLLFPEEPRRSILKRDSNSFEDCNYKSPDRQSDNRRSKSFEEREEEYEKARRRIFKDGTMQDCSSQEDFNWADVPWPENECSKIRLLPPEPSTTAKQNRLLKVQSVEGKSDTLRPCVAKSYSFGGYGGTVSVLTRGDSVTSTQSAGPRLLTKQDSSTSTISWRLSPSSSGYKSQSQRSDSVTPSPTTTPHQLSDASGKNSLEGVDPIHNSITEETVEQAQQTDKAVDTSEVGDGNQLVWAVTDMQSVPKGSILINPQTGQPVTNQDGSIYHFDPSNPPPGFTNNSKPRPSSPKTVTPQKSPVKERSQSPKKSAKTKSSPVKNKSYLINSSTSPSLPMTPPAQNQSGHNLCYSTSTPVENATNMPIQPYPVFSNGYAPPPNVPGSDGTISVYQPPVGMIYTPYGMPNPYESRPDSSVTELSGYFVNMTVSDPACSNQSVGFQTPSTSFWGQQPVTYYPPPTTQQPQQQQRYPVQIPVPTQTQGTFLSNNFQPNYVPVAPNPAPIPSNTDLVPVYTNQPMVYPAPTQQTSPPNPMFIQNPNHPVVYSQNPMFPQSYPATNIAYPANSATPNSPANPVSNLTYTAPNFGGPNPTPPNQCYGQNQTYMQNVAAGFDQRGQHHRSTPKNKQCSMQKIQTQTFQQTYQNSNHSSGGSNSPANTVITGYFPSSSSQPLSFRQCTPPETPPNQNIGYGYPPNFVQHSMIFRPLGGIRASPPVNLRSSRSPTPAPEYPQVGTVERNQRYSVGPAVYHGMPCIVPGDMRLMTGRAQPPVYRQPIRQQNTTQSVSDNSSSGRSHKVRKARTKVPALPPSGRQSNHSVQTQSQQRF